MSRWMRAWSLALAIWRSRSAAYYLFPYNLAFLTRIVIMMVFVLSLDLVLGLAASSRWVRRRCMAPAPMRPGCSRSMSRPIRCSGLAVGDGGGAVVALVSGLLLMRAEGLTLIMLSIAVAAGAAGDRQQGAGVTGGADGLRGIRMAADPGPLGVRFRRQTGYIYACCVLVRGVLRAEGAGAPRPSG